MRSNNYRQPTKIHKSSPVNMWPFNLWCEKPCE